MSEGALRAEPRPAGPPVLERIAASILERGLTHLEGGTLVVTLPDGTVRLEISRTAANSVDELARFSDLVARLRARGVTPLDERKTALGGRCP